MNRSDHQRACDIIMLRDVEEISPADSSWLDRHLAACSECSDFAESLQLATRALRGVSATAGSSLVIATQLRVRERVAQLHERSMRNFLIAFSFCIGVLSSAMSAYLWWRFGAFVAERFGWSASVVQPGIFVVSTLPAVIIAIAMLASSHPVIDRTVTMAVLAEREGGRQ